LAFAGVLEFLGEGELLLLGIELDKLFLIGLGLGFELV
jgi:hypothetical protein